MGYLEQIVSVLAYNPKEPMLFNSALFLVLFMLFLPLYYLLKDHKRARVLYVVLFSLYFYYKSSGVYMLLLVSTATVDFILGRLIYKSEEPKLRKLYLWLSVLYNLGMLGYFKYTNFLWEVFGDLYYRIGGLLGLVEGSFVPTHFDILLPVGISFFVFQSMSYVIDIYRRDLKPVDRWIDYLFYISFFPQIVAGPIVRAKDFLPQIGRNVRVSRSEFGEGLFLIMCGLIKKAIISDYISLNFVDRVFEAPALYSGFENLMAIYGYAVQIYCDFSGYSDMAIGIALWLGFRFNINFDSPYQSASITEFWRRWHISLSSWLRDYLYISLGGNRKGRFRTYLNNLITMFLGGLWHGANWRFIIWGMLHGVALVLHKFLLELFPRLKKTGHEMKPIWRFVGVIVTFHFVCFAWIFFRMEYLADVWVMLEMVAYEFHVEVIPQFFAGYKMVTFLFAIGLITHFIPRSQKLKLQEIVVRSPMLLQALLLAVVMVLVLQFKSTGVQPFIYFQF
ncbi:MAG: MBOAT family protein [Porphyromonas sp.]|nr:MBOAT family protein [Porphyromonas sp.]